MLSPQEKLRYKNTLVTGPPGVGKTTVMLELARRLADRRIAGFHTEEIRRGKRREGFAAATLSGQFCVLAHLKLRSQHRVGRYGVDVEAFEALVLPELARPCDMLLIDEIGKMECFSSSFVATAQQLLDGPIPVVATVAIRGGGFISEAKARPDVQLWNVTKQNRDELPERLAKAVTAFM
jgi:nucleoside-triphosphatase